LIETEGWVLAGGVDARGYASNPTPREIYLATESSAIFHGADAVVFGGMPLSGSGAWSSHAKQMRNRIGARLNRIGLERTDFTVISNDCWGQALYEGLGLACRTPLVGAGMHANCFLRFLGDLEGYLGAPLRFISISRHASVNRLRMRRGSWPMAVLGDGVEVHFLHYRSEEESRAAWEAGCRMVNLDRVVVKFTIDKDGGTAKDAAIFDRLPFERKLLLSVDAHPEIGCAVQVPNYVTNGAVMFRRSLRDFDCVRWLNTGEIRRMTPRVLLNKAIYARGV
jgi:uncharacterized protein (DUF1919 family)